MRFIPLFLILFTPALLIGTSDISFAGVTPATKAPVEEAARPSALQDTARDIAEVPAAAVNTTNKMPSDSGTPLQTAQTNANTPIDKILIHKAARKMYLLSNGKIVKEYDIALGFEPIGAKERQGDGKTPEGLYKISGRNIKSRYHKSLRVNYPAQKDLENAKAKGIKDPGGDIMIHGLPNGMGAIGRAHLLRDWTLGCIAVTSDEIDEIWELVPNETPVEIRP